MRPSGSCHKKDETESVKYDTNGLIVSAAEIYDKVMKDTEGYGLDDKSRVILLDISRKIDCMKEKYKVENCC